MTLAPILSDARSGQAGNDPVPALTFARYQRRKSSWRRFADMVEAAVKYIDYLDEPPSSPGPFMVAAQAGIGNEIGTDIFQVVICNAEWIAERTKANSAMWPRGCLIVRSFEPEHIKSVLESLVANFVASSDWDTFAERLNRYLVWEFEDIDDSQGEPPIPQSLRT